MNKIGIIGLGHMGQAMIKGFIKNGLKDNLVGYHFDQDIIKELNQKLDIKIVDDYQKLINEVEMIIVAVRPGQIDDVAEKMTKFDLKNKIIISIISGLTIKKLTSKFNQEVLAVRALPNLNAEFGLSVTGVQFDSTLDENQKIAVLNCLNQFGKTYEIAEDQFSAFTVLGGCTPAYFFKIVDALYQSGVKAGLDPNLALDVVIQSGYGSLTTLLNTEVKPNALVDAVCVPNGITIEGINYLNEKDFDKMIDEAIVKSIKKDLQGH